MRAAEQRLERGEGVERPILLAQHLGVAGGHRRRQLAQLCCKLSRLQHRHVEAEHELAQPRERAEIAILRAAGLGRGLRHERQRLRYSLFLEFRRLGQRLQSHQWRARVHLAVHRRQDFADDAGGGRHHLDFHLHRFDPHQRIASGDALATLDLDGGHHRGHGRCHETARIALDQVGDVIDLDEQLQPVRRREHAMAQVLRGELQLEPPEALELNIGRRTARGSHPVLVGTEPPHLEPVALAQVAQLHGAAGRRAHARPSAPRFRDEAGALEVLLRLVRLDPRHQERRLAPRLNELHSRRSKLVEQSQRDLARNHLGPAARGTQPGLGRAAAAQQEIAIRERLLQPMRRLRAVRAGRD